MSDCTRLSDRMPAVALGRSTWTADESSHLAKCPSCQEEMALIRVASHLGVDVASTLESNVVAASVLQRLARNEETILRRRSWGFAALASAAAVAAIVLAGRTTRVTTPPAPAATVASIPLPELDNLLPAELNAVLQTIDEPYVGGSAVDSVAADPDDEDLEYGLEIWEG